MKFLTDTLAYVRIHPFIWILAVVVIGFGTWFALGRQDGNAETITVTKAPFEAQVSISGKVVPSHDVELGFSQGGRVAHVYVTVGKKVAAGAILAETENGDVHADVLQKQAKLAQLKEGTRSEELAVKETAVKNADATLRTAIEDAYRASDAAVHNTADPLFSNPRTMPVLNFTTTNSQFSIDAIALRSTLDSVLNAWRDDIDADTIDIGMLAIRSQENLIRVNNFLAKCNTALNAALTNSTFTANIITGYIADIATARTSVNTAVSAVTTDTATLLTAEKNLTLARAGSRATDIVVAQADVMSAQAQLAKTHIVAPFSGTVTRLDIEQGEIAQTGTSVVALIGGTFQIEAYVPEVEIAALKQGDTASVYLDAYGKDIPFAATIIAIDPAETVREGISTYKTTLQFIVPDDRIRSGMTANILITTERRESAIVIPLGAVTHRDDKSYVKIKEGKETTEREVTLGAASVGQVEVVSGLNEGDAVVLNP